MLYELVIGYHPFHRPEDSLYKKMQRMILLRNRISTADYVFTSDVTVSDEFKSLINGILKLGIAFLC